jgi:DNA-binding CsgD family transcriptional regulator
MAAAVDFPELFERALRLPQVDRWPFDLARVRLFYGERLRRSRHSAAAREQLERAEAIFLRLGATPWAERARTELLATSATKSPAGSRSAAGLTPQEHAVAGLAAVGFTNRQIAERLQISHRTVGAHLRQVFRKLGVPTRAALHDGLDRVGGRFVQRARP